jgi:hypothetical protein
MAHRSRFLVTTSRSETAVAFGAILRSGSHFLANRMCSSCCSENAEYVIVSASLVVPAVVSFVISYLQMMSNAEFLFL